MSKRKGVGTLFLEDMRSLFQNVVSIVMTLGLVIVPPLFAWYNTLASWDVFDNTGNLKVAVASVDEGYESDLFPVEVNVGDQVLSQLRANKDIGWVITDEKDAIDGAKSGRYYAAVIIPESFSRDMLTFYSTENDHADIVYYVNEKASAIAPKVTDQGASGVSASINQVFTETLSEVSLALAKSISTYAQSDNSQDAVVRLSATIEEGATSIDRTADVVDLYAQLVASAQTLTDDSSALIDQASGSVSDTMDTASSAAAAARSQASTLESSAGRLSAAFDRSSQSLDSLSQQLQQAANTAGTASGDAAQTLRDQASLIGEQKVAYEGVRDNLVALCDQVDETQRAALEGAITRLDNTIELLDRTQTGLNDAADALERGDANAAEQVQSVVDQVNEVKSSVDDLKSDYDTNLKPGLEQIAADTEELASDVSDTMGSFGIVEGDLSDNADALSTTLGNTSASLSEASAKLRSEASNLHGLSTRINEALASGDNDQISAVLNSDLDSLADAISAPVGVERIAVNPIENFGSGMSSLYSSLAIFIGSLLIVVAIKPTPHDKVRRKNDHSGEPRSTARFMARLGAVSVVSLMQTTLLAVGNIFFLQIQVAHPMLYILICWLAGLVNTAIMFSLVVALANLGKALGVILLIMQVTGCGGSFPLEVLPGFVQRVSVLLPAYHVVSAMRAAMQGIYANDFWIQCGELLLFLIPAALIGLVLREPLGRFVQWFVRKTEESKLIE